MNDLEYGLILNSLSEGVCTINQDLLVTCFNRAAEEITGFSAEEAIGKPLSKVFRPEVCNCKESLEKILHNGDTVKGMATRIQSKRAAPVPIRMNASPIYGKDGIVGAVMTFRDETGIELLRQELRCEYCVESIVTKNSRMRQLLSILPNIADSNSPVLVLGESGTGKELFAKALHKESPRKDKPFVAVNCGALPDTLLESELFGYKKGAFTDAKADKPGRFAMAQGGTLFLDEIGDISPAMQVKLLRVLQEKVYEPLGSSQTVEADVRIIAATNRDLKAMMQDETFRSDLYYRINVVELQIPPLRERKEDVPLLVGNFIERYNAETGKTIRGISQAAMSVLMKYSFPGNIRELENIVERAYVMCPFEEIQEACLPLNVNETEPGVPNCAYNLDRRNANISEEDEKDLIARTLQENRNHRRRTADALGIDPSTLWRKMKKHGMLA
ncbi:MAG: sigma 54-interacting transcriptional regulator [Planctomycetes bacterium]|nr:sigma 54-interacting transcriptional regulator [Planctomycetota bacterium]